MFLGMRAAATWRPNIQPWKQFVVVMGSDNGHVDDKGHTMDRVCRTGGSSKGGQVGGMEGDDDDDEGGM